MPEQTTVIMQQALKAAEKVLNNADKQKMAIVLTVGSFDGPHIGNYISNVRRADGIIMLRTTADRIEAKT